jgi:hypothetical protein
MRIGNNFWINDYKDFCELKSLHDNGARLASPLVFSHEIKDDGTTYYCFCPTDRRVDGCLYLTEYNIASVFDLFGSTVTLSVMNHDITFTPTGITIDHGKQIKYKHEYDMVYRLQKTQYKGESAYGFLAHLVDPFWDNVTHNALKTIGYIA